MNFLCSRKPIIRLAASDLASSILKKSGHCLAGVALALALTVMAKGAGNAWTTQASLPTPRVCVGVAEVDGAIYAIGGATYEAGKWIDKDQVEMYDPSLNTWKSRKSITTPRGCFGTAVVDGKIYALGGVRVVNGQEIELDSVEAYDPVADTWTARRSMPRSRQQLGAATVNGKIYVIGGKNCEYSVDEYDPASDTWTSRSRTKFQIRNSGIVSVGGKIYVIGGNRLGGNAVLEFDPAKDSWRRLKNMPVPRTDIAVAACEGRIYVFGGHGRISATEEFDPTTETWKTKSPMPAPRGYHGAASVGGRIFMIGGSLDIMRGNEIPSVEAYTPRLDG